MQKNSIQKSYEISVAVCTHNMLRYAEQMLTEELLGFSSKDFSVAAGGKFKEL